MDLSSQDLAGDIKKIFMDYPDPTVIAQSYAISAGLTKLMGGVFFAFPVTPEFAKYPGSTLFKILKFELPNPMTMDELADTAMDSFDEQAAQGAVSNLAHRRTKLPAGETEEFAYVQKVKIGSLPEVTVGVIEYLLLHDGYLYDLVFLAANDAGANELRQVTEGMAQSFQFIPVSASPVATTAPQTQPIRLVAAGFGQGSMANTGYGFIVENPNEGHSLEGTYRLTAFDATGAVLQTASGEVGIVLPGQRLGIGGNMLMPSGARAARIDVQLQTTRASSSPRRPAFSFSSVSYQPSDYMGMVKADILNPYDKAARELRISTVAYNSDGVIIGGETSMYMNSVPAHGMAPITSFVFTSGPPARIDVYGQPTSRGGMPW